MDPISRRSFLLTAAAGLVGSLPPAHAVAPIDRTGEGRMRLSLSAFSLRKPFRADQGEEGALDMMGFVDYAAGLSLDGVELTSYFFPDEFSNRYLARLKRRCHVNGLDITGGAIHNNFTLPPGDKLDHWFDHVRTWAEHYGALGAPVNRVFAGRPPEGTTDKEAIRRAVPNLERACRISGKRGVMLALENHDFLTDVRRMLEIVRRVESPWFGVNLDTGNFREENPYRAMEKAAPYAVNVQVKAHVRPKGADARRADFERIVKILHDAGYSGPLALEYEADEDPYEGVPKHLDKLREAMEKVG